MFDENGADIIVCSNIANYIKQNLSELTRFNKAKIEIIEIEDLRKQVIQKEQFKIIVPSLRLDSIVTQLCNTSRNKAEEIILAERVFINYKPYTKNSKEIKEGDKITIRGKGKFEIGKIIGNTKKDKIILEVEKYI